MFSSVFYVRAKDFTPSPERNKCHEPTMVVTFMFYFQATKPYLEQNQSAKRQVVENEVIADDGVIADRATAGNWR